MAKYMFKGSYAAEGVRGLLKEGGSSRIKHISKLFADHGCTLESAYFSHGEDDVVGFADMPDRITATAMSLAVNASGVVKVILMPLITPEEIDAASKVVVNYKPAGS